MRHDDWGVTRAETGWRKSGHSNPSGACVEVARLDIRAIDDPGEAAAGR